MTHDDSHDGTRRTLGRRVGFWFGLLSFFGVLFLVDLQPGAPLVTRMAAVAMLMAVWWIADAIPLAATALLPIVLFPLLGILRGRETAPLYVNHVIFLFVGGFMIALAMERWNLHRRIALWIIRVVGSSPPRLVLAFMVASALLSMWISNTATAIMMLAIGLAIIAAQEQAFGAERTQKLSVGLLLGIAYGASIGGVATLVGTPPNLSFARIFEIVFPEAEPIGFGQWMLLGVPLALIMLVIVWLLITGVFFRAPKDLVLSSDVIRREHDALGSLRFAEGVVLVVFLLTAGLWITRNDLDLGVTVIDGWAGLLPYPAMVDDGTIAIAMALLLFAIPSRSTAKEDGWAILDNGVFARVPWHIVLLFGGGFALAKGFQVSGLSVFVGAHFAGLEGVAPVALVASICGTMTFLTELTSNTATTEMMLPILASAGTSMQMHPLMLMIPATLSASCAFMLPVATPPNAIIFGSGRVTVAQMAGIGVVINFIGVVVITVLFTTLGTAVFSIDPGVLPDWAQLPAAP